MARSIEVIQKQIVDSIKGNTTIYDPTNLDPNKRGLTSPSQVSIWLVWTYVVAVAINIFENLMDLYKAAIEVDIALAPPGIPAWLQDRCFKFQYDSATAQVLQIINFVPQYPTVDATKRIITQCAIVPQAIGGFVVKVAASLAPLNSSQLIAFTSFLQEISFGVPFNVISANPDLLWYGADVYYDGQYSPTIQQAVSDAIDAYIADFNTNNFNGEVTLSKLEDVIQSVTGVKDVVLRQIELRADGIAVAAATKMVDNKNNIIRTLGTFAGYMIIDTDGTGRTTPMLNFIVQ